MVVLMLFKVNCSLPHNVSFNTTATVLNASE